MASGASATVTIVATDVSSGTKANVATVSNPSPTEYDPNPLNDLSSATTTVTGGAAPLCVVPGKDGAGGTLTGIVNTYYPGTASVAAGVANTCIAVGTARGAAAISANDLLLVIQMQDATINSTNTASYGDGTGRGAGALAVNAGKYEFVRARGAVGDAGCAGGAVGIAGSGANGGLLNAYTNADATAAKGQARFQVVRVPQYTSATLGGVTAAPWTTTLGGDQPVRDRRRAGDRRAGRRLPSQPGRPRASTGSVSAARAGRQLTGAAARRRLREPQHGDHPRRQGRGRSRAPRAGSTTRPDRTPAARRSAALPTTSSTPCSRTTATRPARWPAARRPTRAAGRPTATPARTTRTPAAAAAATAAPADAAATPGAPVNDCGGYGAAVTPGPVAARARRRRRRRDPQQRRLRDERRDGGSGGPVERRGGGRRPDRDPRGADRRDRGRRAERERLERLQRDVERRRRRRRRGRQRDRRRDERHARAGSPSRRGAARADRPGACRPPAPRTSWPSAPRTTATGRAAAAAAA